MICKNIETFSNFNRAEAEKKAEMVRQKSNVFALSEAFEFLSDPTLNPVFFSNLLLSF